MQLEVHAPEDRALSVWIGGSVLAAMDGFEEQWMSQDDYFECGLLALAERWAGRILLVYQGVRDVSGVGALEEATLLGAVVSNL